MSLTEISLRENVRHQYLYQLKSRPGLFIAMAGMQVLALLFSWGGVGYYGMGTPYLEVSIKYYSSDLVVGFTIIWMAIIANRVTTREYQDFDFSLVSNRLSGNLANAAFLATAALVGGVTAILAGFLLRLVVYFKGGIYLPSEHLVALPEVVFAGMAVTVLYLLLFGALGYFCGILARLSKVFVVLLAGLFFAAVSYAGNSPALVTVLERIYDFYRGEGSLALLAIKVLVTALLLYACSFVLSNRLEVR